MQNEKKDPVFLEKEENGMTDDELLFQTLAKTKKRKRRNRVILVLVLILLAAVGIWIGMRVARQKVRTQFASASSNMRSEAAHRGSISTVVSGSGMLVNVDTETVTVPAGVKVTQVLVEYGDVMKEGDMLALVDMASVRTAMSDLQNQISSLDKEITKAKSDTVSSSISSGVAGRVKAIYAEKGDLVEDVMVDSGALALLSLDGYMAAEIHTEALRTGESVSVVRPDGSSLTGSVDRVLGSLAVILVTDNGPENGEIVKVFSQSGEEVGSAPLYIHNSLAITGYAGTISYVSAQLNQQVYAYSPLFQLTDTQTTVNYDALLRTRTEYEETLLELLKIQRYGSVVAPISGSVYSAADPDLLNSAAEQEVAVLSPDVNMQVTISVDEADILSLAVDQKADISVRSIGDAKLTGVVTEIDKTYSSGSYTAVVVTDKVPGMIPGMTANVDVRIEGVDDAVLIPAAALQQTSTGCFVYTSYDPETKEYGGKVDVVPGLSNSSYVEIRSGLEEGDVVYYERVVTFNFGAMGMGSSGRSGRTGGSSGNSGGSQRPGSSGSYGGYSIPAGYSGGMPSGFGR